MNKINKYIRKRFIDTDNKLTSVKRNGCWGLGENGKGIKHKKKPHRKLYDDY